MTQLYDPTGSVGTTHRFGGRGSLLTVTVILWAVFAWLAVASPASLDSVETWLRGLSGVGQLVAWVVLLPWLAGLTIWQSSAALVVRVVAVAVIAAVNLLLFARRG
jgi:hypothetical protein